uniref:Uncharacterized protein n=1 Tax=Myotis myotis TaxID=51298 RepID=A0A7J7XH39_MYOMY|nr:hypothetical protein mMyoMyo1_011610 [Myotis myotis]
MLEEEDGVAASHPVLKPPHVLVQAEHTLFQPTLPRGRALGDAEHVTDAEMRLTGAFCSAATVSKVPKSLPLQHPFSAPHPPPSHQESTPRRPGFAPRATQSLGRLAHMNSFGSCHLLKIFIYSFCFVYVYIYSTPYSKKDVNHLKMYKQARPAWLSD